MSLLSPNHFQYDTEFYKQSSVLLKCVSSGIVTIPVGTSSTQITIINLPLNISALCNKIIKIDFVCNITLIDSQEDSIHLMFQVNRHCNNINQIIPIGKQWIFSNISDFVSAGTFSFFVCDCDFSIEDCFTYTVDVTPLVTTSGAIISNSILSATLV